MKTQQQRRLLFQIEVGPPNSAILGRYRLEVNIRRIVVRPIGLRATALPLFPLHQSHLGANLKGKRGRYALVKGSVGWIVHRG